MEKRTIDRPPLNAEGVLRLPADGDSGLVTLLFDLLSEAGALTCEHDLELVPGATHLFEEPGTLDRMVELAAGRFTRWLDQGSSPASSSRRTSS